MQRISLYRGVQAPSCEELLNGEQVDSAPEDSVFARAGSGRVDSESAAVAGSAVVAGDESQKDNSPGMQTTDSYKSVYSWAIRPLEAAGWQPKHYILQPGQLCHPKGRLQKECAFFVLANQWQPCPVIYS